MEVSTLSREVKSHAEETRITTEVARHPASPPAFGGISRPTTFVGTTSSPGAQEQSLPLYIAPESSLYRTGSIPLLFRPVLSQ